MSVNISIHEDVIKRLTEYQKPRKLTRSGVIQYAIDKLFASEEPDPKRDNCLERAIKRWVNIPFVASPQVHYGFLYMLATKYPNQSARDFWSEACFIGPRNVTHRELLAEIKNGFEILFNA